MSLCSNCGANLLPGSTSCIFCEHPAPAVVPDSPPLAQPSPSSPAPPRFPVAPPPPFGFARPPPPPLSPPVGYGAPQAYVGWRPPPQPLVPTPNFTAWFLLGLVGFFICQVSIPGLIGGIIALSAKGEWERGAYDSALKKLRTAKILIIVSYVVVAMFVLLYVLLMAVGAVAGGSS